MPVLSLVLESEKLSMRIKLIINNNFKIITRKYLYGYNQMRDKNKERKLIK